MLKNAAGGQESSSGGSTRILTPFQQCCVDFLWEWRSGRRPDLAAYLTRVDEGEREILFQQLLEIELTCRRELGEFPSSAEYTPGFARFETVIDQVFQGAASRPSSVVATDSTAGEVELVAHQATPPQSAEQGTAPLGIGQRTTAHRNPPRRIGKYEIVGHLGQGGFGDVWKGRDPVLDRIVAVKVMRVGQGTTPWDADRFLEEGRKLARLQDRGVRIIGVHDAGVDETGAHYLVTQFLPGGNLDEELARRGLTWREATELVADLADALAVAHGDGVYHRDIKPKNILLDAERRAYLADFGLAASRDELESSPRRLGTRWYMSPEQAGSRSHVVDGRTDIYSLGVVLYQLLTGRLPYPARDVAMYERLVLDPDRRPSPIREVRPDVPPAIERACLRCLEKDPTERYATARDLAIELRAALAPPVRPVPAAPRSWGPIVWGAFALAAVALIASINRQDAPAPVAALPAGQASVWTTLFGAPPKDWLWPGIRGVGHVELRDGGDVLSIQGSELRIARLAPTPAGEVRFAVDLQEVGGEGESGIVWGLHESEWSGLPTARMQGVLLHRVGPKLYLSHWGLLVTPTTGQLLSEMELGSRELVPSSKPVLHLEIRLQDGQLQEVRLDSQTIAEFPRPELVGRLTPEYFRGELGLFVRGDTALVTHPEFEVH